MTIYIALLRGINVGGNHKLPMAELKALLEGLGLEHVKTYIQSGNVVFQGKADDRDKLTEEISLAIETSHGFAPKVLLLEMDELALAMSSNPFPQGEVDPKTLHLYFLASVPTAPDLEALAGVQREREQYHLADRVLYLYAPDGIGRSKLATLTEKALGVNATARNWRSVSKIMALAEEIEHGAG
mgnify:CR=1 FL=1